jgi:predicted secreted protein
MLFTLHQKTIKSLLTAVSTSFLIWCLFAGTTFANAATAEKPLPIAMNVKVTALNASSETLGFTIKPGEYFKVELYAAGGTGYEWVLVNKKLNLVKIASHFAGPEKTPALPGGIERTVFLLQAKPGTSGKETVTFSLRRVWEPADMAAKTVHCEVNIH